MALTTAPSSLSLQPRNLTFHNLCKTNHLPPGTKSLLGLNLKYCLSSNTLPNDINSTMLKLARSIRTKYYLAKITTGNSLEYEKQIYKKNLNWNPPPAPLIIEDEITEFEKAIKSFQKKLSDKYNSLKSPNLNPFQQKILLQLRKNHNIIIKPTDKNLGPAAMDTTEYIKQALQEHLLTNTYKQLSEMEAKNRMIHLKEILKNLVATHSKSLSKPELTYFQRSLQSFHRLPIFYGLPKVHKNPVTLRPVVSTSGSLLAIFSTWLDYKMKELLPLVQSYVKNSFNTITELKNLQIPKNALLFSADATSMYTNIDTTTGISAVKDFILTNKDKIPNDFPTNLFLYILNLVMENNIFTFANTYWWQLTGTAMGTPVACAYATVTFGQFENSVILNNFRNHLLFYKRYIDDIIGIWLPSDDNDSTTWNLFKETLNSWGNLKWIIEEPSKKTVFLDLEIQLQDSTISFKTYQKDMNLYLYIPPSSAHPPSCFKGLIMGEVRRYWLQNNPDDFQKILCKFIERLTERGHTVENIKPFLEQAALLLDTPKTNSTRNKNASDNTLYIHKAFHPNGLQRKDLRNLYQKILEPFLNFDKMTIAMSRPTNLRDVLTKASLTLPTDTDLSHLIKELKQSSMPDPNH
jgi:hypothetical protein